MLKNLRRMALPLFFVSAASLPLSAQSADWPQWRGPHRDGQLVGFKAPAKWPEKLTQKWKVEVGIGHASPLLAGESIYLFSRKGDDEAVACFDASNGMERWHDSYPAPYEMHPAARAHGKGPKSTPTLSGGKLYTLGISGIFSCYDASSGKLLWRNDSTKTFKNSSPLFGVAMSPLVEKDLVFVHLGGNDDGALTAFDAKSGPKRWEWKGDGPAYGSPLLMTVGGTRQVVTQTQKMCVGLSAESGALLWSLPFTTPFSQNSISPLLLGPDTVMFAGLQQPTFACRISKSGDAWKAEKIWENSDGMLYMSNPILDRGKVFGMSHKRTGQLFSLDAATGKTLWLGDGRLGENAAILDGGDTLFVLTNGAELRVYKKDGEKLAETTRYQVAESPTWATPVIDGKRIIVKDLNSLIVWEIGP